MITNEEEKEMTAICKRLYSNPKEDFYKHYDDDMHYLFNIITELSYENKNLIKEADLSYKKSLQEAKNVLMEIKDILDEYEF